MLRRATLAAVAHDAQSPTKPPPAARDPRDLRLTRNPLLTRGSVKNILLSLIAALAAMFLSCSASAQFNGARFDFDTPGGTVRYELDLFTGAHSTNGTGTRIAPGGGEAACTWSVDAAGNLEVSTDGLGETTTIPDGADLEEGEDGELCDPDT